MEPQIFLIRNVKDKKNMKEEILAKIKAMVSASAALDGNMINVSGETTWARSKATITFVDKGPNMEVTLVSDHAATTAAIGAGCLLAFFGLILVVVPWLLYDQDKNAFTKGLVNVINYFVSQG